MALYNGGMGFTGVNKGLHENLYATGFENDIVGSSLPPQTEFIRLLEDGGYRLLEDGGYRLLESST